jgi:hypothetical protein
VYILVDFMFFCACSRAMDQQTTKSKQHWPKNRPLKSVFQLSKQDK